jgi:hypothetical protein
MMADFGVSVSIRDSSKMTWRSASISLGSKVEAKAMASRSSSAVLVPSLGTRIWKVV